MRNLLQYKRTWIGLGIVSVTAGLIALGCDSDGVGSKIGNGIDSLGRGTETVVSNVGNTLTGNAGPNPANGPALPGSYGDSNQNLINALTLGSKFSDLLDMDNPQRQESLGQAMAVAIMNRYPLYSDTKTNDYVNLVGMTIAAVSPRPDLDYTFAVLDTPEVGAFSTPGGYVFITRGALAMASDESELAGVLAHEVAHVALNHGIEAVKNAKFNDIVVSAGEVRSREFRQFEAISDGAAEKVLNDAHSRDQENQADHEAVNYLIAAGYDPDGFVRFLQKLETKIGAGGIDIMKTHPGTGERIHSVQAQIAASKATGVHTLRERFASQVR